MDIRKYIYGHCIKPVKVRTFDALSRSFVVRELPCGKCLHCRNTHINEWTTRLYAQSLYSKNVYFITLDYAPFDLTSSVARKLAAETAAVYHDININHTYGMHPLCLCRNHLQDFFKRLRRNTSKTLQYFACGEYGTHAGGKGFGRPHFHIILFSNQEFTQDDMQRAWTVNGYKIGRVDFHDLRINGSFCSNSVYSSKYVFRYVCKYLQKDDFSFEKLSTFDFHRSYYRSLLQVCEQNDLFSQTFSERDEKDGYSWSDYCKDYAPFTCCSKRPSIGLGYFNEHLSRFAKGDFRLFGLPNECPIAFPRYYLKKTKQSICPFMALGDVSREISSNSRIGYISSVLHTVLEQRLNFENFGANSPLVWCEGKYNGQKCLYRDSEDSSHQVRENVPYYHLHMYDFNTNVFYQFCGYGYNLWHKVNHIGFVKCGYLDIVDVLHKIDPLFEKLSSVVLQPFHYQRVFNEYELNSHIDIFFQGDRDKFFNYAYQVYQDELSSQYKHDKLTNNSKISF